MFKNLFIFLFGLGRSGTSAVLGYLNLSPDINMAFEENLMILQQDNKKIWASPDQFSFDHELCKRTLPPEFNGNKIILGPYFVSAERIAEAISRRVVITNSEFSEFKVLFVNRNKEDLIASIAERRGGFEFKEWAEENYKINGAEIEKLKMYYPDHYSFDFYDFLGEDDKARKGIFDYLGLPYSKNWINSEVDTVAYGKNRLSVSFLSHFTPPIPVSLPVSPPSFFEAEKTPLKKSVKKKSAPKSKKKKGEKI